MPIVSIKFLCLINNHGFPGQIGPVIAGLSGMQQLAHK